MRPSTECAQIDAALDGKASLLSAQLRRHLDECPRCRTLYAWAREGSRADSISPALKQRIAHSMRMSLAPVKPALPRMLVLIAEFIALFVVLSAGLTALMGTAGIARASLPQLVGVGVPLAAGVCLFSAMLASQMRPGSYQPLPWHVVLAAVGLAILASMAALFPWEAGARFIAQGMPCLVAGVAIAVPAAALLWLFFRRGAPLSKIATCATLGATAGLLGVTALQIKCPHLEAPHLLVWHGSVLLIAFGAGVLIGWLAQRSSVRKWLSSLPSNENRV